MLINVFRDITYGDGFTWSVSFNEFIATIEKDDLEKFMLPIIEEYEKKHGNDFFGDNIVDNNLEYFYVEYRPNIDYSNPTSVLVKTYF